MSELFTPSATFETGKERDWPANLGMMDWDSTNIVFTKRTLIEFLKYTGTTVDTNFYNISKLPKYAKFGKMSAAPAGAGDFSETAESDGFKPTRRVRTVPGGPHTDIFAHEQADDALSTAPPRQSVEVAPPPPAAPEEPEEEQGLAFPSSSKPSRRVRQLPGGADSIGGIFGGGDDGVQFKPTRKVRQRPGGDDHVNDVFQ